MNVVMGHQVIETPHLATRAYEDYDKTKAKWSTMNVPWELIRYSTTWEGMGLVVEKIKERLFSVRPQFNKNLQLVISDRIGLPKGDLIDFSEIVLHLQPIDVGKAALLTTLEE